MAHGLNSVMRRGVASVNCKGEGKSIGSRRIFAPHFKLQVLDSYRNDADCKGNQRATARKYGIHRRQIQKWLQVENTLRHSVNGAKEKPQIVKECESELTLNGLGLARQRDDETTAAFEARVPALSSCQPPLHPSLPLDFSTRPAAASPPPLDLSFKRPTSIIGAPVRYAPPTPPLSSPPIEPHPDVWDLSTKNSSSSSSSHLKRKSSSPVVSPKPVKLFKPYLDDLKDEEPEGKLEAPCCVPMRTASCEGCCCGNNNVGEEADRSGETVWGIVNVETDVKSEYGSPYTLHELQPDSPVNYYYYPHHPQAYAPPLDLDCPPTCCYEDHPLAYACPLPTVPPKQRQSYSLDFKLRAIESYYRDDVCKGNQRAVASKYNVHRRQVQKWLKQAEELRLRNETMKQIHAVR
ncbi:unnamed protein product [Phaedon cochleariae]|uniref:Brinker DNA-binding domain-containing protein n=1 Tax=Phaedon cochleariae TaxID=80249 RepID=A0A9P0DAN6_PHACE|nr:unnamed protein product [Phaedon cochleariae]